MAKERYTAIIFTGDKNIGNEGFVKWHSVTSLTKLPASVMKYYPLAKWVNVYSKSTKQKVDFITF